MKPIVKSRLAPLHFSPSSPPSTPNKIGLGAFAVSTGDYRVVLHPMDVEGNVCGIQYGSSKVRKGLKGLQLS